MILTNNLNAERSVLSTLMMYNDQYDLIGAKIKKEDFESVSHQVIFAAIVDLAERNQPHDIVMIADLLESGFGGVDFSHINRSLAEVSAVPTAMPKTLMQHIELIKSSALRRQSLNVLKQGIDRLQRNESIKDANNEIVSDMLRLGQDGSDKKEVYSIDDMAKDMIERIALAKSGVKHYIGVGFPELDSNAQIHKGDLVVIAARPSMGKSLLVVNMQAHLAKFNEGASVFFSVEMSQDSVMDRLSAAECGIPLKNLKSGSMSVDEWASLQRFISDSKTSRFRVVRKTDLDVSYMRMRLNQIKRESGSINSIGVDYLQLMAGLTGDDAVRKVADVTRNLKMLADEFDCPLFLLSQLNRAVEKRPNKRPVMSDLRESGAIEQDADIIMFIYREDYYKAMAGDASFDGTADIIIAKNREGELSTVKLAFEGHMGRFNNLIPTYHDDEIPDYGSN